MTITSLRTFPLCTIPTLLAAFAYIVAGLRVGMRMHREGKNGNPPSGFAVYLKGSYTPEGQRLLATLRKWLLWMPVVFIALAYLGGTFCRLAGWSRPSP